MKIAVRVTISFLVLTTCLAPGTLSQPLGDSPARAYERLYAAVKSRNIDAITQQMTKKTIILGANTAKRQKTPLAKIYANGFTATTFSSTLPEIRQPRVNRDLGAVEVWNASQNRWEDVPFMLEDGSWKLAMGELFDGTYRTPELDRSDPDRPRGFAGELATSPRPTALAAPKPPAPYKITAIKVVPFDEITGQFRDAVDPEQWFGNDLSMSLFVTIELSGDPGGYVPKRNVQITVTEGKKVKLSKIGYPGVFSEQGKYYVPVWLYGSMCDIVKITASVTGQKTRSSLSRKVNFHCGE